MSLILQKQIPALQASVLRAVTSAVQATTQEIAEDAQGRAPVDTGELRESIIGRASGLQGEVNAEASHALWVEIGTQNQPAQPFLTPAVLDAENDFVAAIAKALK